MDLGGTCRCPMTICAPASRMMKHVDSDDSGDDGGAEENAESDDSGDEGGAEEYGECEDPEHDSEVDSLADWSQCCNFEGTEDVAGGFSVSYQTFGGSPSGSYVVGSFEPDTDPATQLTRHWQATLGGTARPQSTLVITSHAGSPRAACFLRDQLGSMVAS